MTDDYSSTPTEPGWYPDPKGVPKQRYWDGDAWHINVPSRKLQARAAWWEAEQMNNCDPSG